MQLWQGILSIIEYIKRNFFIEEHLRKRNLLMLFIIVPIYLVSVAYCILNKYWLDLFLFTIGVIGVILFLTSYLFQALIAFIVSVYLFFCQQWMVGLITFLLSIYLVYASNVRLYPNHLILRRRENLPTTNINSGDMGKAQWFAIIAFGAIILIGIILERIPK